MSAYGTSWSLTFLEYTNPQRTIDDYPVFLEVFGKDVSGDRMYIVDSYHAEDEFGEYDVLASLFTLALAKQRNDMVTLQRLLNFLYGPYSRVWSSDGRTMYYDTLSIEPFMQPVLAIGWILANAPVTILDLASPRSVEFWDHPYISAADDDNIWVYQATWDTEKSTFILNIRVDETASLTFANFDSVPIAYSAIGPLGELVPVDGDFALTLDPGVYNLVII